MHTYTFPDGFLWGAATAAHQVEGGNRNDWSEWEAEERTKDRSGRACDHWRLPQFREDIALARRLHLNAYRLSVEWSRIQTSPIMFEAWALGRYREMVRYCKEQGMYVSVTLHHFTNPLWFRDMGGWEHADIRHFLDYVDMVVFALDEYVDQWVVFNEPMAVAIMGWITGEWPPGKRRSFLGARNVLSRMARTHNRAYRRIRRQSTKPIGIAHSMLCYEPGTDRWRDRILARIADRYGNQWFLKRIHTDFIGVNYYMRERWRVARMFPPKLARCTPTGPMSDYGWEIYPKGIHSCLMSLKRYGKPVYITENGIADAADGRRAAFIRDHLSYVHKAIEDGVDVRGYFYWSLLDNFEWSEGFSKRFGLIRTDFTDGTRHIRPSAFLYANVARTNTLVY